MGFVEFCEEVINDELTPLAKKTAELMEVTGKIPHYLLARGNSKFSGFVTDILLLWAMYNETKERENK